MAPILKVEYTPEEKAMWQAAYKEGFEAGKKQAIRELRHAEKAIADLEAFPTHTATFK